MIRTVWLRQLGAWAIAGAMCVAAFHAEAKTFRFRAHSMYDPDRYRDKAEIERWKERDPLTLLAARLFADGTADAAVLDGIDAEVMAEVDASVAFAEAGTDEGLETLHRYVTSGGGAP